MNLPYELRSNVDEYKFVAHSVIVMAVFLTITSLCARTGNAQHLNQRMMQRYSLMLSETSHEEYLRKLLILQHDEDEKPDAEVIESIVERIMMSTSTESLKWAVSIAADETTSRPLRAAAQAILTRNDFVRIEFRKEQTSTNSEPLKIPFAVRWNLGRDPFVGEFSTQLHNAAHSPRIPFIPTTDTLTRRFCANNIEKLSPATLEELRTAITDTIHTSQTAEQSIWGRELLLRVYIDQTGDTAWIRTAWDSKPLVRRGLLRILSDAESPEMRNLGTELIRQVIQSSTPPGGDVGGAAADYIEKLQLREGDTALVRELVASKDGVLKGYLLLPPKPLPHIEFP